MYYREVCVLNKHFWCCYFCYVVAYCLLFYTNVTPAMCVFIVGVCSFVSSIVRQQLQQNT